MRWTVEEWSREHSETTVLEPSDASVDPSVEVMPEDWNPIAPTTAPAEALVFIDGVRRIDARVWLEGGDDVTSGLCASYAAGAVAVGARAIVTETKVERGLFTRAVAPELVTSVGVYRTLSDGSGGSDGTPDGERAVQDQLRKLETAIASRVPRSHGLVVVDGPLSTLHRAERTMGYIKTHRVQYLDEALMRTVHRLAPGERTPLFRTTTSWSRYSSYLRLPGPARRPWAGIARVEVSGDTPLEDARRLVAIGAATLPRYASIAYKDARAPQNLFPIGALERELRHRLGDAALVQRALRNDAAS